MSGKGNRYDNAPIESFWGLLKNDLVYHKTLKQGLMPSAISSAILSCTTMRSDWQSTALQRRKTRALLAVRRGSKRVWAIDRQDRCRLTFIVRLRN